MADRFGRRDDRRPPRDDTRNHRPRYEQDRSRSPPRRDGRDDRRRDRSPPRGAPNARGPRSDRDRDYAQNRGSDRGGPPRGRPGDRRDLADSRTNNRTTKTHPGSKRPEAEVKTDGPPEDEDSEAEMKRIMGFKDFRTTKNTKVPGNDKNYAVHKVKKAEYRQYMNRMGGFNRPLSPTRT